MMFTLLLESAIRSLALGAAVWVSLRVSRVRNTQVQMTAWTLVLVAAILMPALMRWSTVTISAPAVPMVRMLPATGAVFVAETVRSAPTKNAVDWQGILGCCYLAGAILLLSRVLMGLILTWRLWRTARPVPGEGNSATDVRYSEAFAAPVTFGPTILLPAESIDWSPDMRQAVLAHEKSHVDHGDFYIQLLASFYRAIFWFNPLAWWLRNQLAELAETRSDDAAISSFPDRASYAGILLGFAKKVQLVPVAVAMARPATVARRVERILAGTPLTEAVNWKKKTLLVTSLVPLIALAAGCSVHARAQGPAPSSPAPTSQAAARATNTPLPTDADGESYAVVTGKEVAAMNESRSDARRAQMLRDKVQGDYVWFERDLKFYYITDPALVERAKALLEPEQELGRQQAELGKQQAELGQQQARMGEQQARATVQVPDLTSKLDALRMQMDMVRDQVRRSAGAELRQEELGDLQGKLGDLQARFGDLQAQVGDKQARIGEEQAKLGEKQAQLGERQAELGEQQARRAEEASRQIREMLDDAVRRGLARPVE